MLVREQRKSNITYYDYDILTFTSEIIWPVAEHFTEFSYGHLVHQERVFINGASMERLSSQRE